MYLCKYEVIECIYQVFDIILIFCLPIYFNEIYPNFIEISEFNLDIGQVKVFSF